MTWLRCIGWFVFLLLLSCPIAIAEGDEKVIVEGFNDIYYMEDKYSVDISTKITFVGDDYNNGDVPIEVKFYNLDWDVLYEEEVNSNKIRTHVGMDGYNPIYEYHNYTATFGFETNLTGDLEFRLMVNLGNHRGHNEVYTVNVNPHRGYDPSREEVFFTSTVIIFSIILIMTVMSIAAGKVVMERRDLSSKTSTGLEINSGDAELDNIVRGTISDDRLLISTDVFKPVPEVRGTRVLKSQTSHSEMDMDEV